MNDTVVVITGAAPLDPAIVAELPVPAIVLAADGALDDALAAGLQPAKLVGDLDSVSPDGLAWAQAHATIERHSPDKDRTDTELALSLAIEFDPDRIVLVAGGGDRLDHTVAAIGALGHPSLTSVPSLECRWGDQLLTVLHGPGRCTIATTPGSTLSLLAMHGPCDGVTIDGVKWPLTGARLEPLVGHGVSNLTLGDHVTIAVSAGVLTIFRNPSTPVRPLPTPTETTP